MHQAGQRGAAFLSLGKIAAGEVGAAAQADPIEGIQCGVFVE